MKEGELIDSYKRELETCKSNRRRGDLKKAIQTLEENKVFPPNFVKRLFPFRKRELAGVKE